MSSPISTPDAKLNPSKSLVILLAVAVGMIAANLYYAQPLASLISQTLGLSTGAAGLVVTLTQVGYGFGVLMVVPLGDIIENKKLILIMLVITIVGLLGLAFSTSLVPYFAAAFATGLGASTVQIIVPYSASLVPEAKRGQMVGSLMSGLMLGIMLARPTASFLTDLFSWHAVFVASVVLMSLLWIILFRLLPHRQPANSHLKYFTLLKSMLVLYTTTSILRRRAIYQAFLFGAFCLFWTASPLLLAGPDFRFSQTQIAIFALVGVAGAVSAPYAGRAADRGFGQRATAISLVSSSLSFVLSQIFVSGSLLSLISLGVAAVLLDAGVSANLVLGQRAIFSLAPELRGRLNALYIAIIFVGGASGSALGALAFSNGGWPTTAWLGFAFPLLALIYFLTEYTGARVSTRGE